MSKLKMTSISALVMAALVTTGVVAVAAARPDDAKAHSGPDGTRTVAHAGNPPAPAPPARGTRKGAPDGNDAPSGGWVPVISLKGHTDAVRAVAFGPRDILVTGGDDELVRVWDARTGMELTTVPNPGGGLQGLTCAADASWVAFRRGKNGFWRAANNWMKDGKPISLGDGRLFQDHVILATAPNGIRNAWSVRGGNDVAVFDTDLTKRPAESHRHAVSCSGHTAMPTCAMFSPDGALLATGGADKTARIWDSDSGKPIGVLRGHSDAVLSVDFSPDGKTLATASKDGTVGLWEVATGTKKATLEVGDAVRCVAFSPDGSSVATGGDDKRLRVWDAATKEVSAVLEGHSEAILSVAFSRSGTLLASAGSDRTVRLWQRKK